VAASENLEFAGLQFQLASTLNLTNFHVSLNGKDVSAAFSPTGAGSDLSATLGGVSFSLINGANVLEGVLPIPPSDTQPQNDSDYVKFYVNSTRPLDLNGDGVINCADLAIVRASFGRKTGQAGFDPRADVNGDGVVNVLDLSAVARQIPTGTTCHQENNHEENVRLRCCRDFDFSSVADDA
jgi:hypothetical protein